MPLIYALSHVPPEVSAYGMAKYSRSSASMKDSLLELSQQKAEAFLNTFYFAYGHASIADLAHVPLAIEQISLLAAMEIVDEPLWDGQERSTRYQDFSESPYYRPDNASDGYPTGIQSLFTVYRDLFSEAEALLRERWPKPEDMKTGAYGRTIRARAFDLARYALPLATLTSLGQVTNARVLEQQIRRLMASPLAEVREIAMGMKAAVTSIEPFNLLEARLRHLDIPIDDRALMEMNPGPIAPTLTKYTEPDQYTLERRALVQSIVASFFSGVSAARPTVTLHHAVDSQDDLLAGLVYQESLLSYADILERLARLSRAEKNDMLGHVLRVRGRHDAWPREMQQRPLVFDVTVDVGAFRDLNRHRRLDKIVQGLDPQLGYDVPPEIAELPWAKHYDAALARHYESLKDYPADERPYLLPLAALRRVLLRMDFAEAAYLIELRSRSSGHFSYRRIANQMFGELERAFPEMAKAVRVTPMAAFDPFER
ncbi:FAD-dependent thymidylate synthase [Sulfobacillus harzensis]|uniref:Thymidylate synthase n=1 Tax=Sulfobacillus harzensis TaxID=2729629 RepID=A0A7Y0L988_9FIRM|nr:FAD-dependent thymidylate synthase [Sulfobacillus harzensis]NMP24279.1 thymidylate synthase [Sulfobacillus harzensis]